MKKSRKLAAALLSTMVAVSALSACGGSAKPAESAAADSSKTEKTETAAAAENMHIDVIAKGFQHQFWKAVELGTKKAAEEFKVDVTFQGPDNESAIAQQVEYLNTEIDKKPAAIFLAALDTQAHYPVHGR